MTPHIQTGLLKHLRDDTELLRIYRKTVPFTILRSVMERMTCKAIYEYYDAFGKAPKADFEDFFFTQNSKLSDEDRELYSRLFQKMDASEASKEYVLSRLGEYVEKLSFEQTLLKSADYIEKDDLKGIRKEFQNALKGTIAFTEIGDDIWNFKPLPVEDRLVCPTQIEALDKKIRGYNRKELFLWMAPTNRGKSWALVDGAIASLKAGVNAVYYTLEMSKDNVQHRMLMAMSGLRKNVWDERKCLRITYFDGSTEDLSKRKSVYSDEKTLESAKRFYKRNGGTLTVVELKGGSSTVEDIERHLNCYELSKGKLPDIVFVDYADLLVSHKKFSEDINQIDHVYISLRGLAVEKNLAIVTASQSNRLALDVKKVGLKHMAKSIGKATIADAIVTLNQDEYEYRNNVMRLFVAKMREGERDYEIEIKQCFEIGGFCLESRLKVLDFDDAYEDDEPDEPIEESKVNDNKDKSSDKSAKDLPKPLFQIPEHTYIPPSAGNNGDGCYTQL